MKANFISSILKAAIFVSVTNIVARGLGFIREMIIANNFGLNVDYDVYLVSAVIPLSINSIFQYSIINFLVPAGVDNETNQNKIDILSIKAIKIFLPLSILVSAIFFLGWTSIFKVFFGIADENYFDFAGQVFLILLLTIPINVFSSVLISVHHSKQRFFHPALSNLFLNLITIIIILLWSSREGVLVIAYGYFSGMLLQAIYLLFNTKLLKSYKDANNIGYEPSLNFLFLIPILIIEGVGQFYNLTDRLFFDKIISGGIASINYATNLYMLPMSVFSLAIATVYFPKFSELMVNGSKDLLLKNFLTAVRILIILFLPVSVILFFDGDLLVKLVYQRGVFSNDDTELTFNALKYLSISLIFYSIYAVFNKMLYVKGFLKYLMIITVISISIKILFNIILVSTLDYKGLTLATSISYLSFFFLSLLVIEIKILKGIFFKILIEILFASSVVIFIYLLLENLLITLIPEFIFKTEVKIFFFLLIYLIALFYIFKKKLVLEK